MKNFGIDLFDAAAGGIPAVISKNHLEIKLLIFSGKEFIHNYPLWELLYNIS